MNEIKYTADGKKVVVIGNLNSQEKIVQEVFISNGNEIPSGENFVVKSLHDHPVISWKEKSIKEMDELYNKKKKEYDIETDRLNKSHKQSTEELRAKLLYYSKVFKNINDSSFDRIIMFLTGEIKYLVELRYDPKINEFKNITSEYSTDKIKLISLFGNDDGTLTWGINKYYDGSGGSTEIIPCRTLDEAITILSNYIKSKDSLNSYMIKAAKKYNIELDEEKLQSYKQEAIKDATNSIDSYAKSISKLEDQIKEINSI